MDDTRSLRALVVHESMFGNTERIALAVAQGLRAGGAEVSVVAVADAPDALPDEVDLLVVGAPTHAFSLSRAATRRDAVRQGASPDRAATGLREWLTSLTCGDAQPPVAVFRHAGLEGASPAPGGRPGRGPARPAARVPAGHGTGRVRRPGHPGPAARRRDRRRRRLGRPAGRPRTPAAGGDRRSEPLPMKTWTREEDLSGRPACRCRACGQLIVEVPEVGWVDPRSG